VIYTAFLCVINLCVLNINIKFFVIPLWVLGLLTVTASQTTNISAHPGDNITLWCQHTLQIGEYMHWFKQTNSDVPLSIVHMWLPYNIEAVPTYLNDFKPDRLVMSLNSKNSSLSILNVDISDSGLYYCGWASRGITFGDGRNIDIKGNLSLATACRGTACPHYVLYCRIILKIQIFLQSTDIQPYDFQTAIQSCVDFLNDSCMYFSILHLLHREDHYETE